MVAALDTDPHRHGQLLDPNGQDDAERSPDTTWTHTWQNPPAPGLRHKGAAQLRLADNGQSGLPRSAQPNSAEVVHLRLGHLRGKKGDSASGP